MKAPGQLIYNGFLWGETVKSERKECRKHARSSIRGGVVVTVVGIVIVYSHWLAAQTAEELRRLQPEILPLSQAAISNDVSEVQRLLAAGSDPNEAGPKSPLMHAIIRNHEEVALILIAAGTDVEDRRWNAASPPLLMAVEFQATRVVAALLAAGADANGPNAAGFTPLMAVGYAGDLEATRMLLAAGARVQQRSRAGLAALHSILEEDFNPGVLRLLLQSGAEVDAVTASREVFARLYGELHRDWDRPMPDPDGCFDFSEKTPLMITAMFGPLEAAEILLAHGADLDYKNSRDETATSIAERAEREDMLLVLREAAAKRPKARADKSEASLD